MNKQQFCIQTMKNKMIRASVFLMLFIVVSFMFINPINKNTTSVYRSSQLHKIITITDGIERIDYKNENNIITFAVDLGFATSIATENDKGTLVEYYDENGKPISRHPGYFSLFREYDDNGNIIRVTYLDEKKDPVIIKDGYAIEKRGYNDKNQLITIRYYDKEGNPVCTASYGYGKKNVYDENGMNTKTFFVDDSGKLAMTGSGYASVLRQYYIKDGAEYGQIESEFYYDEHERPVALSLGQYGVHYEYNEDKQKTVITYLDENGSPIRTNKGYTTILRTFSNTDSAISEQYLDLDGKPYSLPEGQYGIKRGNGQTVYLNENGEESFNLKNLLYNSSWIIIPFVVILIIISSFISKKLNVILFITYVVVIVYLTLLFRENIGEKGISLLKSYGKFFADSESRASIIKNIWLFIPLGAFMYRLTPKKGILLVAVILSVVIECIQFFCQTGFCELDDVISNSLGGYIGFTIAKLTSSQIQRIKLWKQIHS